MFASSDLQILSPQGFVVAELWYWPADKVGIGQSYVMFGWKLCAAN
jgi:hypothetical protein